MFDPETPVVQLQSVLGPVGTIQAWNPWKARESVKAAKWWVSKIARLSHGLEEAEDFEAHFDRVVNKLHHESVLEFVPGLPNAPGHIPENSIRHVRRFLDDDMALLWNPNMPKIAKEDKPATAFLVECPLIVRAQWMRHRSQAYLEMSRRYVKGSQVPFQFYGTEEDAMLDDLFDQAIRTYNHLLDIGWPPERARIAIPQGAMTKFWCAAFDRDWQAFLALRNDSHAQAEIRAFATWISDYLESKA